MSLDRERRRAGEERGEVWLLDLWVNFHAQQHT